jgi:hypothetical protein
LRSAAHLLAEPVNVLRLTLHPDGLARRIVNLAQWRAHLLTQLRRRAEELGDARLLELHEELRGYPGGEDHTLAPHNVVLPMRLAHPDGELSFFSISAAVSTATDVTVGELAIEMFYPADAQTARQLAT